MWLLIHVWIKVKVCLLKGLFSFKTGDVFMSHWNQLDHSSKWWLVVCLVQIHYLGQCWLTLDAPLCGEFGETFFKISNIPLVKWNLNIPSAKMSTPLFSTQCIERTHHRMYAASMPHRLYFWIYDWNNCLKQRQTHPFGSSALFSVKIHQSSSNLNTKLAVAPRIMFYFTTKWWFEIWYLGISWQISDQFRTIIGNLLFI